MSNIADKILKGINGFAGKLDVGDIKIGGETILNSNKAINKLGKFVAGDSNTGIRGTLGGIAKGDGVGKSIKNAYTNADGNINWKAAAGTYVGAAAVGRVATGGGLYRDNTGSANLPIVPFV